MKMKLLYVLIIFSASHLSWAYGEDLPEGNNAYLNLSATETTQVEPDLLIATLRFESESTSAKEVQTLINQTMKKALELAAQDKQLNISTDQYSVYKFNTQDKLGEKEIWRGSQSVTIKGNAVDNILALAGKLQEMGLLMSDLHYEISAKKVEEIRALLVENAINKLLAQSRKTAKLIGAKDVKIKTISIDGDNRSLQVYPKLMRATSANMETVAADPVSSPGKSDVTLTVSATVLLKD